MDCLQVDLLEVRKTWSLYTVHQMPPFKGIAGYGRKYVAEIPFREEPSNGMFIYVKIPAGMITSPHSHRVLEEVFIIIDKTTMGVSEQTFELEEGDVVHVEPNEAHWFKAPDEHDVRFIAIKFPNIVDDKVELE